MVIVPQLSKEGMVTSNYSILQTCALICTTENVIESTNHSSFKIVSDILGYVYRLLTVVSWKGEWTVGADLKAILWATEYIFDTALTLILAHQAVILIMSRF